MSAARTKMMDCPESSLSSNELNLAAAVRPVNVNVSGPRDGVSRVVNPVGE